MNKPSFLALCAILFLAVMPACKKSSSGGSDPCTTEKTLSVTTNPGNGTTQAAAPGPDFPLQVTINSSIPSAGVTIEVKARPEASTTTFYSTSISSSTASNNFTITNTPSATPCIVEITVSSKGCSTNKWTGSYRYSKK